MPGETISDCNLMIDGNQYNISGQWGYGSTILPDKIKSGSTITPWMSAFTGFGLPGTHAWWYGRVWDDDIGTMVSQSSYRTEDWLNLTTVKFPLSSFTMPPRQFRGHFDMVDANGNEIIWGASFTIPYDDGTTTTTPPVTPPVTPPTSTCNCNYDYDVFDPCYDYCISHLPTSAVAAPVAGFIIDPPTRYGAVGSVFNFKDRSVSATGWEWDYGDGNIAYTGGDHQHTYLADGTYTVVQTVTNSSGKSSSNTQVITVYDPTAGIPLVAGFTATPTSGTSPLVVKFKDMSTGSPVAWYWDLGDGSAAHVQNPPDHTYSEGSWIVRLTITNSDGNQSDYEQAIKASAGAVTQKCPTCPTGQTCSSATGYICKDVAIPPKCPATCPSGQSCSSATGNICKTLGAAGTVIPCEGLNRSGSLDPACILEPGNEIYLYGAIGLVAVLVLMRK